MPSTTSQVSPAQVQETKSKAAKKKAKPANTAAASSAADGSGNEAPSPRQGTSVAGNDASENAYIRELKKCVQSCSALLMRFP